MFERLLAVIPSSPVVAPADAGGPPPGRRGTLGGLAGTTRGQGLYRFHTRSSAAAADALVEAAYPEFTGRVACFGMDWLRRQSSLDPARVTPEDPEVLLFDVGAGEALEIPTPFSSIHDVELTDPPTRHWPRNSSIGGCAHPDPIAFARCAGSKVPLFLGGADDIGDLESADLDVHWTATGQLRTAAIG